MMNLKKISALAILTSLICTTPILASGNESIEDLSKSPPAKPKPTEKKVEAKFEKETGKVAEQITGAAVGITKGLKKLGKHN